MTDVNALEIEIQVFTLQLEDQVDITIDGVGRLSNRVLPAEAFGWLTPAPDRQCHDRNQTGGKE